MYKERKGYFEMNVAGIQDERASISVKMVGWFPSLPAT